MQKRFLFQLCVMVFCLTMAVQTNVHAQNFSPIPLTSGSFTYSMVIPTNWPYRLNSEAVTVTLDFGPSLEAATVDGFSPYYSVEGNGLNGATFFEIGLDRANATASNNYGLPHGGAFLTNVNLSSHAYQLPYWTNFSSNCLFIGDYVTTKTYNGQSLTEAGYVGKNYTSGSLALNNAGPCTALSFLLAAGHGPILTSLTISYTDGNTQTVNNFGFPDWFQSANPYTGVTPNAERAYSAEGRFGPGVTNNTYENNGQTTGSFVWSVDVALSDSSSAPTNVSFSWTSGNGGGGVLFAVSGSTNPNDNSTVPNTGLLTGPFNPISITGFNAGCVVAAPNPWNATGLSPLNATMDNGTNLTAGGHTWFEQGYDTSAPTNGFPAHGTTIQSFANPTRYYQMPASYQGPMSVLIDTNHPVSNITPVTPVAYTAITLLNAGASINSGHVMTNYIILQHSDGVNESNLFYGYDWFENTVPYAYSANERADIYSSTASSGIQIDAPDFNDTYPRLFESEFGTVDGTPVTNIQVGYLQAGGPNWTTYVIAVSGTTDFVPVQIGAYRAAQNVYPGNAAVFSVTPSLGTLPSYQWQYVNNSGATNNVVNGPTGTGSTISGANSPLSPLTLLVSTSSVITTPGDPIADFYNAIGTADPFPATGLGASNIIDGTLTPYLNYGGAARGNSFTGPVGFVVTPSIGNTVVTAARIYASTNSTADDPADITLYGSTNGLTWSFIAYSSLSLPSPRNLSAGAINSNNEVLQEIDFPDNTTNYYEYAVYFTNAAGGNTATVGIEFAEVQLLGNVILQEPYMVTQPQSASLYVGDNLKLSGVAAGTAPLNYQWQFNGAAISGATNSGITFIPTASANAGSYALIVTNLYGSITSAVAVVTLTPFAASNALAGYWAFDDGSGSSVAVDSSTNGNNGNLENFPDSTSEWVAGRITNAIVFNTTSPTNEYVDVPYAPSLNFNTNLVFSLATWVKGSAAQVSGAGILAKGYGGDDEYGIDVFGGFYRFYVRNAATNSINLVTPVAPNGTWQHLVATYDGNFGQMNFYVDGQFVTNTTAPSTLLGENNHDLTIGCRESSSTSGFNLPFAGTIDDVRIYNRALSASNALALYQAAGLLAPVFYTQPKSASLVIGAHDTLSVLADGTVPLSYQWKFDGATIVGATNSSLVFTNLQTANSGTYSVLVGNVVATNSSQNAVVKVSAFSIATTVGYWMFEETNGLTAFDSSGNGNNGTLENFSDDNSEWGFAYFGAGALLFADLNTATNNVVVVPDSPALNFTNNLAFTLAAWINASNNLQFSGATLIAKGDGGSSDKEQYAIATFPDFIFYVRNAAGTATDLRTTIAPATNWQHVVATYDGNAGKMNFYSNGQLISTTNAPNSLLYNTAPVSIGNRTAGTGLAYNNAFIGEMRDVRIYPQALSAAQVLSLYNTETPAPPTFNLSGASILSNGSFQLNFSGMTNALFTLYSTTNVALPLSQWTVVTNGSFNSNGSFSLADASAITNTSQYYFLSSP